MVVVVGVGLVWVGLVWVFLVGFLWRFSSKKYIAASQKCLRLEGTC